MPGFAPGIAPVCRARLARSSRREAAPPPRRQLAFASESPRARTRLSPHRTLTLPSSMAEHRGLAIATPRFIRPPPEASAARSSPPSSDVSERQAAAIDARELHHDRQPEPGAGLRLVEPARRATAPPRAPPAAGPARRRRTQACRNGRRSPSSRRAETRTRDFAHLQALSRRLPAISSRSCFSPRKRSPRGTSTAIASLRSWCTLRHDAGERRRSPARPASPRRSRSPARRCGRGSGDARPGSRMMPICSATFAASGSCRPRRLVLQHGERRLQRMREIADMRARALDDLAVGIDQRVQVLHQRLDLARIVAFEMLDVAVADFSEIARAPAGAGAGPSASGARCRSRAARRARRATR